MIDFGDEFFTSNKIQLETLDDIDEYMSTIDLWLMMHDDSEVASFGNEKLGYYYLHAFDEPVQIVTPDDELIDSFSAAVVYAEPGDLSARETYSFTFGDKEAAEVFFDRMREDHFQRSMGEEDLVDLGDLREGDKA